MYKAGILTISDKGSQGRRADASGELIRNALHEIDAAVARYEIVADPTREQQQAAADEIFAEIRALYAELEASAKR